MNRITPANTPAELHQAGTMKTTARHTSFVYARRLRAERIYALVGSSDYPDLDGIDTAVLLALNHWSKPDGSEMRPSAETLALMTHFSRSSVRRSLSRLVASGLLVVASRQQHHAPVVYRFAAAVMSKSDKKLREHLAEKRVLLEASPIIAGCSPRRQRGSTDTTAGSHKTIGCSPDVASVSPHTELI